MELPELPALLPRRGEVLIRTHAAGLNPADAAQRQGGFRVFEPYRFPVIAGNEASGTVEAVGEGVKDLVPGDRVV